ncbi:MAG: TIGR00730 family Rossman fold protein [Culturomica sp.]|jgi:uncharacterized protein (TIGR00730 family)|nr:TIGR00730 family Rossman fold protein [Culturomica sp.]
MKVCVFCASSPYLDDVYYEEASSLGKVIAENSWQLIYGGTGQGMMESLARSAIEGGAHVKGVIPECIVQLGIASHDITELVTTPDMKTRKAMMREEADAFIALPGGWGTLEEITEVITLKQLAQHNKPIVFVNTGGYYDAFFEFIAKSKELKFISAKYDVLYKIVENTKEVADYIKSYRPPVNFNISKY